MYQTDEEVIEATGPRETIGTAVALLCAEHNVDVEVDFGMLVQGSAESSERLRTVAATVQQSTHAHDNSQATHKQPLARTGTPVGPARVATTR